MFRIITFIIFIWNIFFLDIAYGLTKSCSGHDACKNNEWSIYDTVQCKTGERVCKNTKLTCPGGSSCSIATSGGGHDNYQDSFVFAEKANSFTLTCGASGQRGCQNNKIWCPTKKGAICTCSGCKTSTKLFCTYGNTCTGGTVENLNQAYCTGTESQMWCQKDECSIVQCPSGQTKCASIKGTTNTHFSMTCQCPNNVYEIPRCPKYWKGFDSLGSKRNEKNVSIFIKARGYRHAHKWYEKVLFVPSIYNPYNNVKCIAISTQNAMT